MYVPFDSINVNLDVASISLTNIVCSMHHIYIYIYKVASIQKPLLIMHVLLCSSTPIPLQQFTEHIHNLPVQVLYTVMY